MKKVLIITSSLRPKSNSEALARAFARGAQEAGNEVEVCRLASLNLGYCRGCDFCQNNLGACVLKDDAAALLDKVEAAQVIVLATPTYYYNVSAPMKTFIDRTYARIATICDKDFYFIATSYDESNASTDGALEALHGMVRCFANCREAGVVRGLGMGPKGVAQDSPAAKAAYRMGTTV